MVAEATRKRIVYVIFVGAVIYGAVNFAGRGGGDGTDASVPTIEPLATASVGSSIAVDSVKGRNYEWKRDPFAFGRSTSYGEKVETQITRLKLEAISEANGHLMAIINGRLLTRGETAEGWTLVRLTKSTATLEQNGKEILLQMDN